MFFQRGTQPDLCTSANDIATTERACVQDGIGTDHDVITNDGGLVAIVF
jgi:hypothetical protein